MEVMVVEGNLKDLGSFGKKRNQDVEMKEATIQKSEVCWLINTT